MFIKPINEYPVSSLDSQQTSLFITFLMLDPDENRQVEVLQDFQGQFPFEVFVKRCAYVGVSVSPCVSAFLSMFWPNPGSLVMFCHAIWHYAHKHKIAKFTFDDLANLFPFGFPYEDSLSMAWDAQKVNGENGLDRLALFKATEENPYVLGK